jgi:hypothetical protein
MAADNSKLGGLPWEVGVVRMSRHQILFREVECYFRIVLGSESLEPPGCETVFVRLVLCAIFISVSTSAVRNGAARTACSCLLISVGNRCCKSMHHQLSTHRYFVAVGCCALGACIIFHTIDGRFFRISEHGLGISDCVCVCGEGELCWILH